MSYAMLLSSRYYDLDTLAKDPQVLHAMLDSHARASNDPGLQLPPAWHIEDVTSNLVDDMWSTERVLHVFGTIVAD